MFFNIKKKFSKNIFYFYEIIFFQFKFNYFISKMLQKSKFFSELIKISGFSRTISLT